MLTLLAFVLAPLLAAAPAPTPSPPVDARAEAIFAKAKAAWTARAAHEPPFVNYGALIRYAYHGHLFDNWWDAFYRNSDGALALHRLVDQEEEKRRLGGVPFSIFNYKVFDTNPEAEPIRLDDPQISPIDSFGLQTRHGAATPEPNPAPSSAPSPSESPLLEPPLRELVRVEAVARDYRITYVGTEKLATGLADHLVLVPLHEPKTYRLRDLWVDTLTSDTLRLRIQGLFAGKPYDGAAWTVSYVLVDGNLCAQQIKNDEPLHFGLDVVIPQIEFDFVDYHFPANIPNYEFEKLLK
ncbi:MAG TPA: hypothetical protein VKG44_03635 [Candidatus Baltobacteraceae bacterium]|nr:hypothetical protein [Candidatus Baltobacteraceae bacterium]